MNKFRNPVSLVYQSCLNCYTVYIFYLSKLDRFYLKYLCIWGYIITWKMLNGSRHRSSHFNGTLAHNRVNYLHLYLEYYQINLARYFNSIQSEELVTPNWWHLKWILNHVTFLVTKFILSVALWNERLLRNCLKSFWILKDLWPAE